jgi:nicotinate-nucleotide adenylyltransferase
MTYNRKVGVLGGSFDPPHFGHLGIAKHVADFRKLDEVLFVVSHIQWQKTAVRTMVESHHRLSMVDLAVSEDERFSASDIEINRGGDSVTAETLESLRSLDPTAHYELIIGSDIASRLPTWRRSEDLEKFAEIVVIARPGFKIENRHEPFNFVTIDGPNLDISSEEIRMAVNQGVPIDHLVPEKVGEYIHREGLYR